MTTIFDLMTSSLSDDQLLSRVKTLACAERHATAQLIAVLGEIDRRQLFLGQGCSSLFTYCTQLLHLSESAAYSRIAAARVARRFPIVLDRLADGALSLTTICLLAPVLTPDNHDALLAAARHKSKRDVEHLVASSRPRPDVSTLVRKLPSPRREDVPAAALLSPCAAPAPRSSMSTEPPPIQSAARDAPVPPVIRPAVVAPLAPERYKIQFTASRDAYDKLRRAQALLRHVIPNGDPAAVFERALDALLTELERRKLAATDRPRQAQRPAPGSRHIPAAVKREVWRRDGARCAFVGATGRCSERGFLELHHVVPFAAGGNATATNIELRCRAHNAYEEERFLGSFTLRERPAAYNSFQTELENWHKIGAARGTLLRRARSTRTPANGAPRT
jgi:5-methylcytosine-specific restriction endonuclease McrA